MQAALLYDAINLFLTVYTDLDVTQNIKEKQLDCSGTETTDHGFSFSRFGKIVHKPKNICLLLHVLISSYSNFREIGKIIPNFLAHYPDLYTSTFSVDVLTSHWKL